MNEYIIKKLSELIPYINNSRTHSDSQVKQIVPVLPFSKINEMGAGMYKGQSRQNKAMDGDQLSQRQCDTDIDAPMFNEVST